MKFMIVDINRCNGCYNCQIACKDEHVENDWSPYAKPQPDTGHFWMHVKELERGQYPKVKVAYIPKPCMQCREPSCLKKSQGGAIFQREDGLVIIDPEKSRGQRQLVEACPYGSIYWNEELDIPQKCTFCGHLLDQGWEKPRCVEACPTDALRFGEETDLKEWLDRAKVMNPEYQTSPRVYYIGLPDKYFIAGSIYEPDINECLEGATVTLTDTQGRKAILKTDNFGDFWFEQLEPGTYSLSIKKEGYLKRAVASIDVSRDVNIGDLELRKEVKRK